MVDQTKDVPSPVNEPLRMPRFQSGYLQMLPAAQKLEPDDLLIVNLDIPTVVTIALGAVSEIRKMREPCAKALPGFDLSLFDNIEPMALAMGYAHSRHLAASLPVLPVQELSERVVEMREVLASDCAALARRGLIDGQQLEKLKGPQGYKNQAFDLLTLVALMRESLPRIQGKTAVSSAELDEAETFADQLLTAVGERAQLPTATVATAEIRQRTYTLFVRAYDELRRAAEYLRWHDGDADAHVPNLYAGKKRKGSEVLEAATNAPVLPVEQAAAKVEPPKNGSPVAQGMPGSDPFVNA